MHPITHALCPLATPLPRHPLTDPTSPPPTPPACCRFQAARAFYEVLVLNTKGLAALVQEHAYGDVTVTPTPHLFQQGMQELGGGAGIQGRHRRPHPPRLPARHERHLSAWEGEGGLTTPN